MKKYGSKDEVRPSRLRTKCILFGQALLYI